MSKLSRLTHRTVLVLLAIVSCIVLTYRIGARSMWLDELSHRDIGMMPLSRLMNDPTLSIQPSHGYYLLHRFSEWVCGDMDVGNRLPSALAGVGNVLLAYLLARHLFGMGAGVLAAVALLCNPLFVSYAQENRFYQLGSVGFLAVFYTLVAFLQSPSWRRWLWFVLAASFALRTHSYGMVTVAGAAAVTFLFIVMGYTLRRWAPYRLDHKTLLWLIAAGVAIVVLWMPFPLRIGQYLTTSKTAPQFDGFFQKPFPLTPQAVFGYLFTNFVVIDPKLRLWFTIPIAAAIIGSVVYGRGRFLVFLLYFLLATLPVIYAMNAARAAVMPKRFLYFLPVLTIWAAGGLMMLVRMSGSVVTGVGWLLRAWAPVRLIKGTALATKVAVAIMLLYVYAMPVLAQGAYDVSQWYYNEWHVIYREVAALLTLHKRSGEEVWWYPPVNDAWLCERYLPAASDVTISLKQAYEITATTLTNRLAVVPGVWVYGVDLERMPLPRECYVCVKAGRFRLYLLRREYFVDRRARDEDALLLWRSLLAITEYPEVECVDDVVNLLRVRNEWRAADNAVAHLERFPRAAYAVHYAVNYWTNRGEWARAFKLQRAFARRHPWLTRPRVDAAMLALQAGQPKEALRLLRWVYAKDPLSRASKDEWCGEAYRVQGNYRAAVTYLSQALRAYRTLRGVPLEKIHRLSETLQQCSLHEGDAVGALIAWLDGWVLSPDLLRMYAFTNLLERSTEAVKEKRDVRGRAHGGAYRYVSVFLHWYTNRAAGIVGPHIVAATRNSVHARTWPLYAYWMEVAPTSATVFALIPPEELPRRGFDFYEFWDNALLWFEQFYTRHGGVEMGVRYWDVVNAYRSNIVEAAAINQAKLEYHHGKFDACIERLERHCPAIRQVGWTRERAVEMLTRLSNTYQRAAIVLEKYVQQ